MALDVFPYQEQGASFMASAARRGNFDEMRVGKSAQAIRAMDLAGLKRGIVICPGTARGVWVGEFNKFQLIRRSLIKGVKIHDYVAWMRGRFDVLITSYEQATSWHEKITSQGEILDFAVVDEAHYCKNSDAARTKAVLGDFTQPPGRGKPGIVDWARYSWMLTGTPLANDPLDIYTFLRWVGCMPLSQAQFVKRYFHEFKKSYGSRNTPRAEMVDELRRLIWNNAIRRTQKEAGLQLPPVFLTSITIDGDTSYIRELLQNYPGLDTAIVQALRAGSLSFLDAQHIATLRRLVGEAKAIPYAQMLFEELQSTGQKYVVGGLHRAALHGAMNYISSKGIHCVHIDGSVPERHRHPIIEEFQTNKNCRVIFINLRAGGTAISLTAACNFDLLESSWSPGDNAQGIMRVQGVSQKNNIRARFITLSDSIDEAVNEIVAGKTAAIAIAQGGQLYTHEPVDLFNRVQ